MTQKGHSWTEAPGPCQRFVDIYCGRVAVKLLSWGPEFLAALLVICISQQQNHESQAKCLSEHSLYFPPPALFHRPPSGQHRAVGEAGLFKAMVLPFGSGVHMCAGGPHFDSKSP